MTMRWLGMLSLVLSAGMARAEPAGLRIEHPPVPCVSADRYPRVVARASAPPARAELQFRTDAGGGWYSAAMAERDGEWEGFLPRPSPALRRLEYRIVMTGADAGRAETAPIEVRVDESGTCAAESRVSVERPIVVTVPEGMPLVPPVPAGLSPVGVVAFEERRRPHRALGVAAAAGGSLIGVAAVTAAVIGASDGAGPPAPIVVPEIRFDGVIPSPGSTLSPNRDRFVVLMLLGAEPASPLTFVWRVELLGAPGVCLVMDGVITGVQRPLGMALTNPLRAAVPDCGPQFDVQSVWIRITHLNETVYAQTHALPFRIQP
jgi:hypothetical protein